LQTRPDPFTYFLRGLAYHSLGTPGSYTLAVRDFSQAIALDLRYARLCHDIIDP